MVVPLPPLRVVFPAASESETDDHLSVDVFEDNAAGFWRKALPPGKTANVTLPALVQIGDEQDSLINALGFDVLGWQPDSLSVNLVMSKAGTPR